MRFIDSSFEIIPQEAGLDGVYKQIERAARVSYKSEDKITEGSAKKMVEMLMKNNHGAALEHGTVYLKDSYTIGKWDNRDYLLVEGYKENPYSRVVERRNGKECTYYVTTNLRVLFENGCLNDLQFLCEPTEYHEKRYTVKFITSIGIGREFTRHRTCSFLQESTRYINYSKGKFNSELTYIIPRWIYDCQAETASYRDSLTSESKDWLMQLRGEAMVNQMTCEDRSVAAYVDLLRRIEADYMFLTNSEESYKLKPQEARGILPMDTKSELVMTGYASDWIHFFNLRSYIAMTGKPHPDAMILANNLLDEFLQRDYIKYEDLYNRHKDTLEVENSESEKAS